jgi:type 1 glutamine amidotransferase
MLRKGNGQPEWEAHDDHGSRVFFTSLGHVDDFQTPRFETVLVNALFWAMDRPVPQARVPRAGER